MNNSSPITLKPRPGFVPTSPVITPPTAEEMEIAGLNARVAELEEENRKLQIAVHHHRALAAKPLRETDHLSWYRDALLGHATPSPLKTVGRLLGQLVREKVVGWFAVRRA